MAPTPVSAQSLTKPSGRGTKRVAAPSAPPRTFYFDTVRQADVKEVCPLCIEELDDTDKNFFPCPCGYQVCLFCYGEVKEKCNALCPGCRREYGEPVDLSGLKQAADERAADGAAARASIAAQRIAAKHAGPQAGGAHLPAGAPRPPGTATISAKLSAVAAQQRKGHEGSAAGIKRDDVGPLPTGATWAAAAAPAPRAPRHQQSEDSAHPPAPMQPVVDESAWPSLAATKRTEVPASQSQSFQSLASASSSFSHYRSTSGSTGSADGGHSNSSSSQDLATDQSAFGSPCTVVPSHLMGSFSSAQVSSTVHGVQHKVHVPLPVNGTLIDPLPEVASLKHDVQEAVNSGSMCSKVAAARLVALLRQKDPEQGAASRSLLAAGKAPPGFTSVQANSLHAPTSASATSLLNTQDPSILGPPLGRYQPIQPPLHGSASTQHASFGASSSSSTSQQQQAAHSGTYSLWSGLPGIELSIGQSIWSSGPCTMHADSTWAPQRFTLDAPVSYACRAPPPGFGPPGFSTIDAAAGRVGAGLYQGAGCGTVQSQLLGYSRPPPPGMSAYRPQLGAGM